MDTPSITQLADRSWAIDFGPPGPFITLPERRMTGLIHALADAGWIRVNGKPVRPLR